MSNQAVGPVALDPYGLHQRLLRSRVEPPITDFGMNPSSSMARHCCPEFIECLSSRSLQRDRGNPRPSPSNERMPAPATHGPPDAHPDCFHAFARYYQHDRPQGTARVSGISNAGLARLKHRVRDVRRQNIGSVHCSFAEFPNPTGEEFS